VIDGNNLSVIISHDKCALLVRGRSRPDAAGRFSAPGVNPQENHQGCPSRTETVHDAFVSLARAIG